MENIIWTNDTGQIDAIIEDWRQDALALAAAMAENPRGTVDETEYGTGLILEKAWEAVVDEYEIPTPRASRTPSGASTPPTRESAPKRTTSMRNTAWTSA